MTKSAVPKQLKNDVLLDVINRGLDALGESPKQALWYYIENEFKMDKNKLHEDLASFQEILQQFFGVGYKYLDALFRQYFEEATQEKFDDNISFVECVHIYTNQQVGK